MFHLLSRLLPSIVAVLVVLTACAAPATPAPASRPSQPEGGAVAPAATAEPAKSIVLALSVEPATLGPFEIGGAWYQGVIYEAMHDFLVVHDNEGQPHARLAEERPSVEKGTWKVNPDGTMETTWKLRRGVQWHDGTEFTARDIVFGWRMANDPVVPWASRGIAQLIDDIRTPDPHTLVMHWKSTFPFADNPDETTLDPLPAHILEPLRAADAQGFANAPYWSREFVGLGPYRLASWEPGSHLELRATDNYYGGRPKIGAIDVRFVSDPNTLIANILSGSIDVNTAPTNLGAEQFKVLEEQWRDGDVIRDITGTLTFIGPNLRVQPFNDVRVRRAMAHAIDRNAVADSVFVPHSLIADTFLPPNSEKAKRLKDRIAVYDYDPARAQALLDEAGWRRGGDGMVRNAAGQGMEFEFRTIRPTDATVVADQWKAVGLQPNLLLITTQMMADLEYQANVKGVERTGYSIGFATWQRRIHSSAVPSPQTRWSGLNRSYYENPEVDALIDRFSVTLNEADRDQLEGQIIQRVTSDAVVYPLYINAGASVVRKGITGLKPNAGAPNVTSYYYTTWNILEWDRR